MATVDPTAQGGSPTDWLSQALMLGGAGLHTLDQGNVYSNQANALNKIGITSLSPYTYNGVGGAGSAFNPATGQIGTTLGALNPAYSGFANFANGSLAGLNPALMTGLTNGIGNQFQNASGALNHAYQGFQPGLENSAFGAAQTQLGGLNQNYNSVFNSTLSNLRANAAPGNLLQANQLQDSLFGTGNSNSTTGNNLATAFGKGLGQADASYQLDAQQAAQSQQQNQLALAQGAAGIGSNTAGLGDTLLNNAFSRFGNTAQLLQGTQSQGLNNALSASQGATGLNTSALQQFQAALAASAAGAQARNGSLSQYLGAQSQIYGTPNGTSGVADLLSKLGGSGSSVSNLLKNMFGGSGGSVPGAGGMPLTGDANGLNPNNNYTSADYSGGVLFPYDQNP